MTDAFSLVTGDFATLVRATLSTIVESSARVYGLTYDRWAVWCSHNGVDPLELHMMTVKAFLVDQPVTRSTRQRELSALRKLAQILAVMDYGNPLRKAAYESLMLMKAPAHGSIESNRTRRALSPEDVWQALSVWNGAEPIPVRNAALLAVMFYTGARRAEIVALRWGDVDLDTGTVHIAHGKGDKAREATIFGEARAIDLLKRWQNLQGGLSRQPRLVVFCRIDKGGHLGPDKPLSARMVNTIVEQTSSLIGLSFHPHDARRTLATDLLANDTPISDVKDQLGHASGSTTIDHYAMPADARKRRSNFSTSY